MWCCFGYGIGSLNARFSVPMEQQGLAEIEVDVGSPINHQIHMCSKYPTIMHHMKQVKNKREIFEVKEEHSSILQFTSAAFGACYCIILLSDSLPLVYHRQKSNFVLSKTKVPFKHFCYLIYFIKSKGGAAASNEEHSLWRRWMEDKCESSVWVLLGILN